jgi:penicillin V acylase-like amidase (Ntn superfamily)
VFKVLKSITRPTELNTPVAFGIAIGIAIESLDGLAIDSDSDSDSDSDWGPLGERVTAPETPCILGTYRTMEAVMHRVPFILAISLLVAATSPIFAGVPQPGNRTEHCSAIVLQNNGHSVFGANYDHTRTDEGLIFVNKRGVVKSSPNTSTTGRRARWTSRFASLTFNLVGFQFAWAGMNERGLSVSTMSLDETRYQQPDARPPLDSGEWMQYILDTCETIDEVLATDAAVRIITVDHYLISDRFGNAAVIEFLDGRMVAHTGPDVPVRALTNSTYIDSCETWESRRGRRDYASLDGSLHRFCLAADRVDGFRSTSEARAIAYAFDTLHEVRGQRFWISPSYWSIVFDTKNLRAYYRTLRDSNIRWVNLEDFDLRCGEPAQMLDIHNGLSEDISGAFFDFDFGLNYDHFENFLTIWGIDHTHESVMWTLNHFDRFSCIQSRRGSPRRVVPQ